MDGREVAGIRGNVRGERNIEEVLPLRIEGRRETRLQCSVDAIEFCDAGDEALTDVARVVVIVEQRNRPARLLCNYAGSFALPVCRAVSEQYYSRGSWGKDPTDT